MHKSNSEGFSRSAMLAATAQWQAAASAEPLFAAADCSCAGMSSQTSCSCRKPKQQGMRVMQTTGACSLLTSGTKPVPAACTMSRCAAATTHQGHTKVAAAGPTAVAFVHYFSSSSSSSRPEQRRRVSNNSRWQDTGCTVLVRFNPGMVYIVAS